MATALRVYLVLCLVVCWKGASSHRQPHNHHLEGNHHNVGHPNNQRHSHGYEANRDNNHQYHQLHRHDKQNHQSRDQGQKPADNRETHLHPGDHQTTTPAPDPTSHHITIKPLTDFIIRSPVRGCPSGQKRDWSGSCRPSF